MCEYVCALIFLVSMIQWKIRLDYGCMLLDGSNAMLVVQNCNQKFITIWMMMNSSHKPYLQPIIRIWLFDFSVLHEDHCAIGHDQSECTVPLSETQRFT